MLQAVRGDGFAADSTFADVVPSRNVAPLNVCFCHTQHLCMSTGSCYVHDLVERNVLCFLCDQVSIVFCFFFFFSKFARAK